MRSPPETKPVTERLAGHLPSAALGDAGEGSRYAGHQSVPSLTSSDLNLSTEFTGGSDLSLGQWQRMALARAFFRDAPFVVLDEPTAALDPRAEAALFKHIRDLFAGRTVLLISHRFSSVRSADRIYVLDRGRIVEDGTHDELMALDGLYADLFLTQAAAYLDGTSGDEAMAAAQG